MSTQRILLGVIGIGGFAREVMPIAERHLLQQFDRKDGVEAEAVFVSVEPSASNLNGRRHLAQSDFLQEQAARKLFSIAIGSSQAREKIEAELIEAGCEPFTVRAPTLIDYDENMIGPGAVLCDHVMITSNARIGRQFQANIYSYVAHDCVVGDYVTLAPRVSCNGNVTIEDHAYIGTGAVLKQGSEGKPTTIGKGAVVGMGAVVTKDVPPFTTVVGNPAKPFERKRS